MALSLSTLKRRERIKPPIAVLYGTHGVGKTTLAAGADDPVLLAVENGIGQLDVPHWDIASFGDVMEAIGVLYSEEHDRRTLIMDSLDWLEPLIWQETCRRNGWQSIEDAGFGKGYVAADVVWREYMDGIRALRDERGMTVVQIAHEAISNFASPDTDPYDRHTIKLHKRASALVQEHADIIAFLGYRVSIKQADVGPGKKITRGVGGGQRVLHLEERPAYVAKNRYSLPASIEIPSVADAAMNPQAAWAAFAQHLPTFN